MITAESILFLFSCISLSYMYGLFEIPLFLNCKHVYTAENVDLDEFVRKTWYSQMQQEVEYQRKDSLYCVTATYNIEENRTVPFFSGKVISVYNYANRDVVNGEPLNTKNGTVLCGRQPNYNENSKLLVAPCNLPNIFSGQYWIIGYGPEFPPYEWLVVSGGQPKVKYEDGCTTKINGTNNAGLWIFSRYPIMSENDLTEAKTLLKHKGYTLSQLIPVEQKGCIYEDAFIK